MPLPAPVMPKQMMSPDRTPNLFPVAEGVTGQRMVFVNIFYLGRPGEPWVLVDTGLKGYRDTILQAVEEIYGPNAKPQYILMTHGHFDHGGSTMELAQQWGVPIYAHRLEMPFLDGRADYPPFDPTVGGAMAKMSFLYDRHGYNFGGRLRELPSDGVLPGLSEWRVIHTPGHTPGHVALFRERDRCLLPADAFTSMNQDNLLKAFTQERELRWSPPYAVLDWGKAIASIRDLAALRPEIIGPSHGFPLNGPEVPEEFARFAAHVQPPNNGRYVRDPVKWNEQGIWYVPPKVRQSPGMELAKVALVGAAVAGALYLMTRNRAA